MPTTTAERALSIFWVLPSAVAVSATHQELPSVRLKLETVMY